MVHTSKLYCLKLKSSNLKSTARPESIAPSTFLEEAKHQDSVRKQIRSGELENSTVLERNYYKLNYY